ncbi:MAG: hypothetical protein HQM07_04870 [Zetaproteobacteria bacterium]|nr:hypothetical protein [Zetaproteobacteria bacterium]
MPTIIIGLLATAFGLWGLAAWWWSVVEMLRGLLPLLLLGFGLLALASGVSSVRKAPVSKKDELL